MTEAVGPAVAGALLGALLAVFALDWYGARELAIWESYEFEAVHAAFVSLVALTAVLLVGIITGFQAPRSGHDSRLAAGSRRLRCNFMVCRSLHTSARRQAWC